MTITHDPLMALKAELSGKRFKMLRKSLGLTRYRVSKMAGVSYRCLENWDHEVVIPRSRTALKVGRALGIVSAELEEKLKIQKEIKILRQRYHARRDKLAKYGFKKVDG
jgi:DNA-binding transcriptional regulator YiaG